MTGDWRWALFLVLISPAVGSFIGVLVDRLPAGRSVLGRSRCAACDTALGPRDLVPIFSAVLARFRCRHCGAPIPAHLLRIEIASIFAVWAAFGVAEGAVAVTLLSAIFWVLIGLFYADMLHFRLPDGLNAALFLLGLGWAWVMGRGLVEPLASGLGAAAVFWGVRWAYGRVRGREGLGLGDIKMMAGLGAVIGWQEIPVLVLIAALMALVIAVLEARSSKTRLDGAKPLPFGSFLAGSAVILLLT